MSDRMTGKVKWFNADKRFGFITPDDGTSADLFVHKTALIGVDTLNDGDKVSYVIEPSERGPKAKDVSLVE